MATARRLAPFVLVSLITALVSIAGVVGAHNKPNEGHVKFAHEAGVANNVKGAKKVPLVKVDPSAEAPSQDTARANATKIPLFSKGHFSIYAKCYTVTDQPDNPLVSAEIFLKADQNGTIFSSDDNDDSGNFFLAANADETDRQLVTVASAAGSDPGTLNISDAEHTSFYAATGSQHLRGNLFAATKVGNPEAGMGVFGQPGQRCVFGGFVQST